MSKLIYLAAATLVITACGGGGSTSGDKKALLKQCSAEGESQEVCECTVNAMADNLSPKLFSKVAEAAEAGDTDAMDSLSSMEQMEFMKAMPALATCMSPELGNIMDELKDGN